MWLLPSRLGATLSFQLSCLQTSRHLLLQVLSLLSTSPSHLSFSGTTACRPCHARFLAMVSTRMLSTRLPGKQSDSTPLGWRSWWKSIKLIRGETSMTLSHIWKVCFLTIYSFLKTYFRRRTRAETARCQHLLQHADLWPDHQGRQNKHHDTDLCDRGHPRAFHRIFDHEWLWDSLLCC